MDQREPSTPFPANKEQTRELDPVKESQDRAFRWAIDRIVNNPDISEAFRRGVLVAATRKAEG